MKTRAADLAREFHLYCLEHQELRFWQALANWAGIDFLKADVGGGTGPVDTWHWKGKGPAA
jgi:hypothetical protein